MSRTTQTRPLGRLVSTALTTAAICTVASGVGLAVNAIRPRGIPLVAPLPYEQDCPEKIDLSGPTISVAQALKLLDDSSALFLDARPEEAYRQGHLPGARSLPLSFVAPVSAAAAARLKRHRYLIVYCDSPEEKLARLLAKQLTDQGLTGVKVLAGGWAGFTRAKKGGARR